VKENFTAGLCMGPSTPMRRSARLPRFKRGGKTAVTDGNGWKRGFQLPMPGHGHLILPRD